MKAMVLHKANEALQLEEVDKPSPGNRQVLIRVQSCGVCRTDLHILDGDLEELNLPLIPGHQIVGVVEKTGSEARKFKKGDKIGVPWLGQTCGECVYCERGEENLCDEARFTGYNINGGFSEFTVADERYCFPIPEFYDAHQAAPLLCAGLIGYRALRMAGEGETIGLYGFGSSAHILTQLIVHQEREVYAFTRPGDEAGQQFALERGAVWAGGSETLPPEPLDAAIIFAPVGALVPQALKSVKKGGRVVCAGIHMSDIPSFSYKILWGERSIKSVANLTTRDGEEFMKLAPQIPVRSNITVYPLDQANEALDDLRDGNFEGSAVLTIASDE
ncbi:zinc-dependent alcohol dehydrogenase family protein [Aliifodinibius salicampi]|uniref:Zinc-dependent alcohol dehydrogenase family protein n=1 Tax=Fodinibius salicampi TaxID=1920655 RepID=A0ABT3PYN6_9BACT|nr:zinc-dependent alcohol dehydrogenase family protein [Fodinibius salicampi]MCW9712972.1 zinc-dependent alcohol dehydrogenase family protein [Fodinibius salicampi]